MADLSAVEPVQPVQARLVSDSEPRWPALAAFVTTWLCPATSARRLGRTPLWAAFLVHLVAVILATIVGLAIQVSFSDVPGGWLARLIGTTGPYEWLMFLAVVLGIFALIEVGFLVQALTLLAWGARDEPVAASLAHSLRFVWLHTAHAFLVYAALMLAGFAYTHASSEYWQTHYSHMDDPWPAMPQAPNTSNPDSKELLEYQAALAEYRRQSEEISRLQQQQWEDFERNQPFWLRYGGAMLAYGFFALSLWWLWALLRALGTPRRVAVIARPPMCDACGYNLTGTPIDSRCPECGLAVMESVGPAARAGTDWERRREVGWFTGWRRSAGYALSQPVALGRQIRLHGFARDHGRFLAGHLALVFLFIGMIPPAADWVDMRQNPGGFDAEVAYLIGPYIGFTVTVLMFWAGMLVTSIVGLILSALNGRNMLPAASQMACYLGGFVAVFTLVSSAIILLAVLAVENRWLKGMAKTLGADDDILVPFLCVGFCLVWMSAFPVLVWRGANAARYANR